MRYYLVQLSYTAESWAQQLARPLDIERRLQALDRMLGYLGAKIADISYDGGEVAIRGKFASDGQDDLLAILVFPSDEAALAFSMAVSAEAGVRDIRMTLMTPLADALKVMQVAAKARSDANYSAPGGVSESWVGAKAATKAARPGMKRG